MGFFRYFTSLGRVTLVPTVLWIGVKMEHEEKMLDLKAKVRGSSLGIVAVQERQEGRDALASAVGTRGFVASLLSHPGWAGAASALGPA